MNCAISLRDRKKAATRAALGAAAARLARQLGVEAVTSEAIAAEAGVSTRTFHNYFSSKEEAVLHEIQLSVQRMVRALHERPVDEPIWDSLEHLAIELLSAPDSELDYLVAVARLVEESPALMATRLRMHDQITRVLGEAIAERTGTDVDRDLYPNLLQVVAGGVMKTVLELVISGETGGRSRAQLASEAFAMVRAGLPQPAPQDR